MAVSATAVTVSVGWCLSVVMMGSVSAQMMWGAMMRVRAVAVASAVRMVLVFMVFPFVSWFVCGNSIHFNCILRKLWRVVLLFIYDKTLGG